MWVKDHPLLEGVVSLGSRPGLCVKCPCRPRPHCRAGWFGLVWSLVTSLQRFSQGLWRGAPGQGGLSSPQTCSRTSWPADSGPGRCLPQLSAVELLVDVAQAGGMEALDIVFCSGTLPHNGSHLKELKSTRCPPHPWV